MSKHGSLVTVDTTELEKSVKDIGDLDFEPFMATVATDLETAVADMFATSGHGMFAPLAPSTLRRKAALGKSSQALIFNGTWRNSPTTWWDALSAGVTTNVPYAVYHVSDAPRSKIPKRDVYELPESVYDDINERLGDFIASGGKEGL